MAMTLCAGLTATGCAAGAEPGTELGERADAVTAANFAFNALQFTGTQFARTGAVVSTAVDNFTVEAWVRWDGGGDRTIFYNGNPSTSGYGLIVGADGKLSMLLGGVGWVGCTNCQLTTGVWSHLAVERQATVWQFFQDGAPRGVSPANPTLAPNPPTGQFAIAASADGGGAFDGALDEVRVWNFAVPSQMLDTDMTMALRGSENGLAAYYRLDEGSGAVSVDASAGNHPLALIGAPIWISSGATLTTGIARDDLEFTGAAYGHASTVVTARTEDITLESWVRWDGGTGAQAVMYNGDSSTSGYGLYLSNGGVSLLSGGVGWAGCQTCQLTPGVWTYLAAVRSDGAWAMYQNGVAQTVSNATVGSAPPSGAFSIAASPSGGERLDGALDEIRVWGVARTAQQIAAGYTVSLTGTEPDLLAYYRLDDGSGAVADDTAGNHPLTLVNAPVWATSGALLATAAR